MSIVHRLATALTVFAACAQAQSVDPEPAPAAPAPGAIQVWLTTSDATKKLARQSDLSWTTSQPATTFNSIVDESVRYQTICGFGASILAPAIWNAQPAVRDEIMRLLFSRSSGIGLSMIRIPMGSTEITGAHKTYDDMLPGQTDPALDKFSIEGDDLDWKIPMMRQAKSLNPELTLMGTPWSAPGWMKSSAAMGSGTLQPQYYGVYANYFVKWLQAWRSNGLGISVVTMQNEPHFEPGSYQGMRMEPADQAAFALQLGPAIQAAGLSTRVICWDHNFDEYTYPITVLSDAAARLWIDGSAFHAYAGDPLNMALVQAEAPDKNLYFTEQTGTLPGTGFGGSIQWHVKNLFITPGRNYSRCTLIWQLGRQLTNLSGDRPFVRVAMDGKSYELYGEYYETGHFSKFVRKGATRIDSTSDDATGMPRTIAYQNPDGSKLLVALNDSGTAITLSIQNNGRWMQYPLAGGSLATFIWRDSAAGSGLAATYFDSTGLAGVAESRIDPTVDFSWGADSPDPSIPRSGFSARWTGTLVPESTGTYTFYTTTSDGVRLWVNDQLVIDHWSDQAATEWAGTADLTANQAASVKMEFYSRSGTARAALSWSSASVAKEIVPQRLLYPPATASAPPPPLRLSARAPGSSVSLAWNASPTAATYSVRRGTVEGGPYSQIATALASTSYTDAAVTAGTTYYYTVTATNSAGTGTESAPASATPPATLPSGWAQQDIGSVGVAGAAGAVGVGLAVVGSGGDIWNTADAFHFVYRQMTGDGTIIARVAGQEKTDPWAKSGVMIRESLSSNATYALEGITPENGAIFHTRATTAASASGTNVTGPFAPHWVKLVRAGNTFTGYNSVDGVTWTQTATAATITMASTVYVGLAVTAHNNAAVNVSAFDSISAPGLSAPVPLAPSGLTATAGNANVGLSWNPLAYATSYRIKRATSSGGPYTTLAAIGSTSYSDNSAVNGTTYYYVVSGVDAAGEGGNSDEVSSTPSSLLLPSGWIDVDVGSVGFAGSISLTSGTYSQSGSGKEIWNSSDAFNYCYETVSGDGALVVRVAGFPISTTGAKAGLMFRESTLPGARYVFLAVTPSYGIKFEYRATADAAAASGGTASGAAPKWLKLVRSGTSFTAFFSANGTAWTQIGSAVIIPMAADMLAGTAFGSGSNSALASATLDNLASVGFGSPTTPIGLAALSTLGGINLSWNSAAAATHYTLARSTTSGGPYTPLATTDAVSWLDSSVANRTTYYYVVSAGNDLGESGYSAEVVATANLSPLPTSWTDANIGTGLTGSADYAPGGFTVRGSGAGIAAKSDNFNFCYQNLSGIGTLQARIASLENTSSSAQAGLMYRSSTAKGDRFAMISVTPGGSVKFEYRSSSNGTITQKAAVTGISAPIYLRLVRTSTRSFSAYYSTNGTSWTQVGSAASISNMPTTVLGGFAVSAYSASALNTAVFDHVASTGYNPPSAPAGLAASPSADAINLVWDATSQATSYNVRRSSLPGGPYVTIGSPKSTSFSDAGLVNHQSYYYVVSALNSSGESANSTEVTSMRNTVTIPAGWSDSDIGTPSRAGSADYASSAFTNRGGGAGIGGASDSFHYCWQPFTGNGTLVARVTSLQGASACTGLMFRESLLPGSAYALVTVTAGSGIRFDYRSTYAATSVSGGTAAGTAPVWLKLVRAGDLFSAFCGPDGVHWTSVGSPVTIPMAASLFSGLATSGFDSASLSAATFDHVTTPVPFAAPYTVSGLNSSGPGLAWDANPGAQTYSVKRSTSAGGPFSTVASGLTDTAFTDSSSLASGALYYYTVSAVNAFGESFDAPAVAALPSPPAIRIQNVGNDIAVTVPSLGGATYQLQRRDDLSMGTWTNEGSPVTGTGSPIILTHPNALPCQKQFYRCVITLPR